MLKLRLGQIDVSAQADGVYAVTIENGRITGFTDLASVPTPEPLTASGGSDPLTTTDGADWLYGKAAQ